MSKRRTVIWIIPFLLFFIAFIVYGLQAEQEKQASLSFQVHADRGSKRIVCWNESDACYVFLPSYAGIKDVSAQVTHASVSVDGEDISRFLERDDLEYDRRYPMQGTIEGLASDICFVKSEHVGTVYIDTASGSMESVNRSEDHSVREQAIVTVLTENGRMDYHSKGKDYLKGHGNWSWEQDKKSYKLELSKAWNVLGMGEGTEYILVSNAMDPSFLRNHMIYELAAKVGDYPDFAPDSRLVDVYFNGEYSGLYLLCERVRSDRDWLKLDEASYLLEMNLENHIREGKQSYYFSDGVALEVVYPKLVSEARGAELADSFRDLLQAVEEDSDWETKLDLDSWVNRYLMDEVFLNYDGGVGSQYFFYDAQKGRFFAGPCWDFDNTLGAGSQNNVNSMLANRADYSALVHTPLFHALTRKPAFQEKVAETYRDVYLPELEQLVNHDIMAMDETLAAARHMNAVRWTQGYDLSDAGEMRQFLRDRMQFLKKLWLEGKDYCVVTLHAPVYHYFYIEKGTECGQLPIPAQFGIADSYNWVRGDTGEIFHYDTVITEDLDLDPEY